MVIRLIPTAFQRHGGRVGANTLKTRRAPVTINRTPQTSFFTTGASQRAQHASSTSSYSSSAYYTSDDDNFRYYHYYQQDAKPNNATTSGQSCSGGDFHHQESASSSHESSSYQYDHASSSTSSTSGGAGADTAGEGATITEQTILNSFPRPNLSPTLHFTVLLSAHEGSSSSQKKKEKNKKCDNCAGPHSTEFCPCWLLSLFPWHEFFFVVVVVLVYCLLFISLLIYYRSLHPSIYLPCLVPVYSLLLNRPDRLLLLLIVFSGVYTVCHE